MNKMQKRRDVDQIGRLQSGPNQSDDMSCESCKKGVEGELEVVW